MNIKETMKEIHENNVKKGFWDNKETKNVGEVLMLCVSELSEALEAHRKDRFSICGTLTSALEKGEDFIPAFETHVKDTFEDEIADTVIRLFDLCSGFGIDLEWHIKNKMAYNATRPFKHNKAY